MRDWMFHALLGNDAHPAVTAVARALVGASLTGASSFLATWQTTDEIKVLISAGLSPAIAVLLVRGGWEGIVDVQKARRRNDDE